MEQGARAQGGLFWETLGPLRGSILQLGGLFWETKKGSILRGFRGSNNHIRETLTFFFVSRPLERETGSYLREIRDLLNKSTETSDRGTKLQKQRRDLWGELPGGPGKPVEGPFSA